MKPKSKILAFEVGLVILFLIISLIRLSGFSGFIRNWRQESLAKSALDYLQQADDFFEQRKFNEAAVEYWNALRKDSNITEAHVNLAYIYHYSYSWNEDAYAKLYEAEKLEPNNPKIHLLLGKLYRDDGRPQEAMAKYQKALELDPQNAEAHFYIGTVYQSEKMETESESAFKQAIEKDKENRTPIFEITSFGLQARLQLARLYKQLDRLDDAIKVLEEAAILDKNYQDAKNELIERLFEKANLVVRGNPASRPYHLTVEIYKKIVAVDPKNSEAWMEMGRIYDGYLGDLKKALNAFQKAYDIDPQNLEALAIIEDIKQRLNQLNQ